MLSTTIPVVVVMFLSCFVDWSSNRTPANYFSAYVYASHFILGVLVYTPGHLILGVLVKFSGV